MEKADAPYLAPPPKSIFFAQVFVIELYLQKSALTSLPNPPVPAYPFAPIEKEAEELSKELVPISAFFAHVFAAGLNS
ncbi:MAG: hypothetical protein ACKO96_09440 [Flammeovirgaceae bacterium]